MSAPRARLDESDAARLTVMHTDLAVLNYFTIFLEVEGSAQIELASPATAIDVEIIFEGMRVKRAPHT